MKKLFLFLACAASSYVSPLHASSLRITGVDSQRGGTLVLRTNGRQQFVYAGVIQAEYDGRSTGPLLCVDVFTSIGYEIVSSFKDRPNASRNEDRASWLVQHFLLGVTSPVDGEALQLAIWDTVHDRGDGFAAGTVQADTSTDPTVLDRAKAYLEASEGRSDGFACLFRNFDAHSAIPVQNLIACGVPEPGSLGLIIVGGLTLAASRRRKRTMN